MYLNFEEFRTKLKSLGLPVFRDAAEKNTPYPYYVYSFSTRKRLMASSKAHTVVSEYRVSLFTKGVESELDPFYREFNGCPFESFSGFPGDENDETVTSFTSFIDVIEHG